MKSIIIILSVTVLACAVQYYELPEDKYTAKELSEDVAEVEKRTDCFLSEGPCTELTEAYKKIARNLVDTKCERCSPTLKELCCAFLYTVREKLPEKFAQLRLKFDPTGLKFEELEAAAGCRKIKL